MARQISDEKLAEIQRLWRASGTARSVALRAGVCQDTAVRYRPADVPRTRRPDYGGELHRRIRELWFELGDENAVAEALKIAPSTARTHRPDELKKALFPVVTGYQTWSEATRERWDRFWEKPTQTEHIQTVMGWNEE